MRRQLLSVVVTLSVLLFAGLAYGQSYTITDIGLGSVSGINASGQVAGNYPIGGGVYDAYIYSYATGVRADIGNFGARSINDNGQVGGNNSSSHVIFYDGTIHDLGIPLSGTMCKAYGMNIHGMMTGQVTFSNGHTHGFLYDPANPNNGGYSDIGTLGGSPASAATDMSYGSSINNSGQILGDSINAFGLDHAFIWTNGVFVDLGTFGGPSSSGMAMNNLGHGTGTAQTADSGTTSATWISHVFWYNGTLHDCGTLGGDWANSGGVNDADVIVGRSTITPGTGANGAFHAFIYYQGGVMTDLNNLIPANSGFTLTGANGINMAGQICVNATDSLGQQHALLLNPTPEPATLTLALLGGLALLRRRRC
jgi:MYXO-CTERM domain-containing protein